MGGNTKTALYLQEARRALRLWGEYMNLPIAGGNCKGYPSQSCIESGGISKSKYAPIVSTPSNLVKNTEGVLKVLQAANPMDFMALKYKYEDGLINEDAAKRMKLAKRSYEARAADGEKFVAALLFFQKKG